MLRLTLVSLLLLGAVTGWVGCGQSDADAAAEAVTTYLRAFGTGDGERACDMLTEETARQVAPRVAEKLGGRDCPDAIRALWARLSAAQARAFEEATTTRVRVRGRIARVRFRAGRTRGAAQLRKTGDGWRISLLPSSA